MSESLRKSGIDIIGDVPWGTHFCQFYQTKEDLMDMLVPYFKAGLENNELCVWITSQLLEVEEAKKAMRKAVPDIDIYLEKGQMEIIPYTYGYINEGIFDPDIIVNGWVEKINQALARGYDGLRATGDTRWLEKKGWDDFVDYEKKVDPLIDKSNVIALCPYYLDMCSAAEIIDVVSNHQFALIKREGKWERIENSGRKRAEKEAIQAAKNWTYTFDAVPDLIAIINDKYKVVCANTAMAARLGVTPEECVGLTCDRVIHGTGEPPSSCPHQQLLEDGAEHTSEICEDSLGGYFAVSTSPLHDSEGKLIGSVYVARDINEHKKVEERLKESEEKYRNIVETANEGILIIDAEVRITYVNKKTIEMLGYSPEELIGRFLWDFVDEEDRDILKLNIEKRRQGINEVYELKLVCKDGSSLWALINAKAFFNKEGKFTGSLGMFTDITDRKQEEYRTRRYNRILEGINQIFSNVVQAKTEEEVGNACLSVALEVTGSEFGFINEMGDNGLLHDVAKSELGWEQCLMYDKTGHRRPPSVFAVHGLYGSVIINEKGFFTNNPQSHPNSIGLPEGHPPLTSFLGVPLVQDGKTIGVIAVANREGGYSCEQQEDLEAIAPAVTQALQRKRSEEALRLSNIYNRSLIEASLDPLVTIGHDGKITDVNVATEQVTGYFRNELIGTDFSDYFTEPEKANKGYQQVFTEGTVRDYPLEVQHKDGHIIPVLYNASIYKNESGEVIGVFAAARDITERKLAEEALRESEKRFRALVMVSSEVVYRVNPDWSEMLYLYGQGFLANTESPRRTWLQEYVPPEDQSHVMAVINEAIRTKSIYELEHRVLLADGSLGWLFSRAVPMLDENGEIVEWFGAASDITERKKVEEALRESEERLRLLGDNLPDSAVYQYVYEPDGSVRFLYFSTGIERLNSISVSDVLHDPSTLYRQVPPEYLERIFEAEARSARELSDFEMETPMKLPDGQVKWMRLHSRPTRIPDGQTIWNGVQTDITERKKAEEALKIAHENLEEKVKERTAELEEAYNLLKESERSLAEAQKMAHIGNWEWDIATDKAYWSEEMYRIFGRDPQKLAPSLKEYLSYIHPDDLDYYCKVNDYTRKVPTSGLDFRIVLANGEERTLHIKSDFSYNDENVPIRVKGIVQDITESKKAEEKIQTLANAVESSNDAVITVSLDDIIASWNKGAEQVYGHSAEEILGKDVSILEPVNIKEKIKQLNEKIKQGEKIQNYETLRLRKDGTLINVSITLSPVFDASGKLVAISKIARDITERIKAEEYMAKIENARKKEIHHRIKNNLQVISSLLDLQAEKFQDKEVLEAFRESQNRVVSMALIHEELYKGEGTDTLDFSTYISELAKNLFQTYSLKSKNIHLSMDLEENAFFDMDVAVPLGIIVNELVSNSLKHAFTEDGEGEIRIKLCREEFNDETNKSLFSLTISDNGKGIPENLELGNLESLGLQLVSTLVDQMDGEIELKRAHGTEFIITFMEQKDHKPR